VQAVGVALIGVFGALLGVIATELAQQRRDEKTSQTRVRSAARMVSAELFMAQTMLARGSFDTERLASLPTTGWSEHGAALASAMTDEHFYVVMAAATQVAPYKGFAEVKRLDWRDAARDCLWATSPATAAGAPPSRCGRVTALASISGSASTSATSCSSPVTRWRSPRAGGAIWPSSR
jgi:hypothetical protein